MARTVLRCVAVFAWLAIGSAAPGLSQVPAEPAPDAQPPGIPPVSDADRLAAFPDVEGHAAHDTTLHALVLFDRLEWQAATEASGVRWSNRTWVGRDIDRLWMRSEGQWDNGLVRDADVHALYGRAIARWWDVVAGVRQDIRPGSPQTWAAVGIQGIAPQGVKVEATGYVGARGRIAARLEAEYDVHLTNRLTLQPRVELNLHGKGDPDRGVPAGLASAESGFRVRYEFRRELAPYLGLTWNRQRGTPPPAGGAGGEGKSLGATRFVTGLRWWY